jgi:UPF0059 membrane protein EUBHAL_00336
MNFIFFLNSILLGVGLAMDACAVSMANGLNEANMKRSKHVLIAVAFGVFQAIMPLIGYFIGHAFIEYIERFIPWIALILLGFLGTKTIVECINNKDEEEASNKPLTMKMLFIQAIATSIDALSVGLTISDYTIPMAITSAVIIAVVTFIICYVAVIIGKRFGTKLGNKAELLGGIILIAIGLEIFITGLIK